MFIRDVVAVACLATTRLASFDAVVTDDKGRHVTDLSPADFEVEERGQSQTVRQVIYVRTADAAAPAASAAIGTSAGPARPSTGSGLPQREQTGRVVAFVVDDLNLSFESIARMRGRGRPILPHPQEARSPLHRHPPL